MKIGIIGVGCVGSVLAERLSSLKKDVEVFFIARGKYAERLQNGIKVNGNLVHVPVPESGDCYADLVFVCVKNYDLAQACTDMFPYVNADTIILPLLNSVTPTPFIKKIYPNNRVLYGYISKIDAYNGNDGNGFYYNVAGDIHFGYANNTQVNPELEKIKKVLDKAGFDVYIDTDMKRGIWKKWMLNVGANQVSALTEADYIQFSRIKEIHHILRLAMQELLIIASYEGVNLGTRDIDETIEYLTTYPYPKKTSMLQDIQAHRRTEVDYISGDVVRLAHKWNCPSPVNLTMYYLIKAKEATYLLDTKEKIEISSHLRGMVRLPEDFDYRYELEKRSL